MPRSYFFDAQPDNKEVDQSRDRQNIKGEIELVSSETPARPHTVSVLVQQFRPAPLVACVQAAGW